MFGVKLRKYCNKIFSIHNIFIVVHFAYSNLFFRPILLIAVLGWYYACKLAAINILAADEKMSTIYMRI